MKVTFTQSGGFAGLIRRCALDTATMKPDDATALSTLVRQARLSSSPATRSSSGRDVEEYEISIDDGGKNTITVHDQSSLPADAKPLIGFLKKCARPAGPS